MSENVITLRPTYMGHLVKLRGRKDDSVKQPVGAAIDGLTGASMRNAIVWNGKQWVRCLHNWEGAGLPPAYYFPHHNGMQSRGGPHAQFAVTPFSDRALTRTAVLVHLEGGTTLTDFISVSQPESLRYNPSTGYGRKFFINPMELTSRGGRFIPQDGPNGINTLLEELTRDMVRVLPPEDAPKAVAHIRRMAQESAALDRETLIYSQVPREAVRPASVYYLGRGVKYLGALGIIVMVYDTADAGVESYQKGTPIPLATSVARNAVSTGAAAAVAPYALNAARFLLPVAAGAATPVVLAIGGTIVVACIAAWAFDHFTGMN